MEPRHLRLLRRAAEQATAEVNRVDRAASTHFDAEVAGRWINAAEAAERRTWSAYRRAYNAQVTTNERTAA